MAPELPGAGLRLRPAAEDDLELLFRIYSSTREDELALVDWSAEQKHAFLRQQFEAQHQYYHASYHDTSWDIIEVGGEPGGRLYVARWPQEIYIVDITLLPAFRGQGLGRGLLESLLAEGQASGRVVRIHVEMYNRALQLYERLGFSVTGLHGVYYALEWRPAAPPPNR